MELEIAWIFQGIKRMFKDPDNFFKEVALKEMNLVIPVIILVLTGIIMGITVYHKNIPLLEVQLKENLGLDVHNIEKKIETWKLEAILYPVWIVIYWALFTLFFSVFLTWLNGLGDFKGMFNCTSFIVYPHFLVAILVLFLSFIPVLKIFALMLQLAATVWTFYILAKIAEGPGQLPHMHAIVGAGVPYFFMGMLWYLYDAGLIANLMLIGK